MPEEARRPDDRLAVREHELAPGDCVAQRGLLLEPNELRRVDRGVLDGAAVDDAVVDRRHRLGERQSVERAAEDALAGR